VEEYPDSQGQCGQTSLLIGMLATLTSAGSVGLPAMQDDSSSASILSPLTNQRSPTDRSLQISEEVSDRLVHVYLERVNPRYPFLHLDTFLGWYESWKTHSQMDRTNRQQYSWKDYFVTMVRSNLVHSIL
jgi:hypothetical protein